MFKWALNCMLSHPADVPSLDVCAQETQPPCSNGGVCRNMYESLGQNVDTYCDCPVGWIGETCETSGKPRPLTRLQCVPPSVRRVHIESDTLRVDSHLCNKTQIDSIQLNGMIYVLIIDNMCEVLQNCLHPISCKVKEKGSDRSPVY